MRLILGLIGWFLAASAAQADDYNYFLWASRGDLSQAAAHLSEETRPSLTDFKARFLDRTNSLDTSALEDPFLVELLGLYQEYWRDTLLSPGERAHQETALVRGVNALIEKHGISHEGEVSEDDQLHSLAPTIEAQGAHAIVGRTPPLLELMLWRNKRRETHPVALVGGNFDIPVTYAEDFVSVGWLNFATFGSASTGGWATKDGIFCVSHSWDFDSENFQISFLKHEGQHYLDASRYPNLSPADREYRAKLTELAFAKDSLHRLLKHFAENGSAETSAPHPLANWHVMRDMEAQLFEDKAPQNWWMDMEPARIQSAARALFNQHDAHLTKSGPETTQGTIRPISSEE